MDNFRLNIVSDKHEVLKRAIEIAFLQQRLLETNHDGKKMGATHYAIRPAKPAVYQERADDVPVHIPMPLVYGGEPKPLRMVFSCNTYSPPLSQDQIALPFTLDVDGVVDFAWRWLKEADYGKEDDIDGDCEKGFRVYNESWGRVDHDWKAIIAIAPEWALYGK